MLVVVGSKFGSKFPFFQVPIQLKKGSRSWDDVPAARIEVISTVSVAGGMRPQES